VSRGGFGVEIFFVLSGFLITHLLLREETASGHISIRLFYARRSLRILPPVLCFLAVLAAAKAAGAIAVPTSDLVAGLLFIRNYDGTSAETGHLWTLAIEEQYYLLWPFLLLFVRGPWARIVLTWAYVVLAPFWIQLNFRWAGGADNVNSWRTDLRMAPLAVGSLLALLPAVPWGGRVLEHRFVRGFGAAVAATGLLGIVLLTDTLHLPVLRAFLPTVSWLCVAVIINCLTRNPESWPTRVLGTQPVVWIGTLSYSLYLYQQPFAPNVPGSGPDLFRQFPVNLCCVAVLAVASYYVVEQPLLSLRGKLRGPGSRTEAPCEISAE
jgi:peptidoglycan/LPS O-acetylase OafA/YrhL